MGPDTTYDSQREWRVLLPAKAGERAGIGDIDRAGVTSAASSTESSSKVAITSATVSIATSSATTTPVATSEIASALAPASATSSTIATASASAGFHVAHVNVEHRLLLALSLALGLFAFSDKVVFLGIIFAQWLSLCPLLVRLTAFVWLSSLGNAGTELQLLFCLLSKVVRIGFAIILWFRFRSRLRSGSGSSPICLGSKAFGVVSLSIDGSINRRVKPILFLGLGNFLASFFILPFGTPSWCSPRLICLFDMFTVREVQW